MFLASGELCGLPIPLVLFLAYCLWRHLSESNSQPANEKLTTNSYTWTWREKKLGFAAAVRTVIESSLGYTRESGSSSVEVYRIGRDDKTWVADDDKKPEAVQWRECTRKLHVSYQFSDDSTVMTVFMELAGRITFSPRGQTWFRTKAQEDIDQLGPLIDKYYAIVASSHYSHESSNPRETTDESPRDNGSAEQETVWAIRAALEELGVGEKASWQEVQRAYRLLCRQYHPDTVASKDYPPHIVHLMEEKFDRVTQAYDFLKDTMSAT